MSIMKAGESLGGFGGELRVCALYPEEGVTEKLSTRFVTGPEPQICNPGMYTVECRIPQIQDVFRWVIRCTSCPALYVCTCTHASRFRILISFQFQIQEAEVEKIKLSLTGNSLMNIADTHNAVWHVPAPHQIHWAKEPWKRSSSSCFKFEANSAK